MDTTTTLPFPLPEFYNRNLLMNTYPELLHEIFADVYDLPENESDYIKFTKYQALTPTKTALSEGVTPPGQNLSKSTVRYQVQQYGDYVKVTDKVSFMHHDKVLIKAGKLLGEQAGQSRDLILADILNAGTNVIYANGSSRGSVGSAHKISATMLANGSLTLRLANAKKINGMVMPSQMIDTTPVAESFVALTHARTRDIVETLTGFTPIEKYAFQVGKVMPGEYGKIKDIRFLETNNAKIFEGEGNGGIDVYSTLILGRYAYGVSTLGGRAIENIIKPLGSSGTADPLNQRATSGWKMFFGGGILQQLFMVRLEHAV